MDFMNKLLNCLNSIDYDTFDEDTLNELLDSRDSAPFDTEWCRVDEEIKALKNTQSYTDENIESELSDYVSDDIGLIYDSIVLNYKDEWLNKLIGAYKSKKIPAGEL